MSKPINVRTKICGITRIDDALAAAGAGADAIGLVFYPKSPRAISAALAKEICASLPAFVTTVGLFVNASAAEVDAILQQVPLDLLQFHGDESQQFCSSFGKPYLKAVRIKPETDLKACMENYHDARGILVDAWHKDVYGGSGETFDWERLATFKNNPRLVLAGGLSPDNVAEAIKRTAPWAVDVSSGVETEPGLKSEKLINAFIEEVKRV